MIRPAAARALRRWAEVIVAGAVGAVGAWLALQGGYILTPIGALICAFAAIFGAAGYRRMRFAQDTNAAGFIEITEGQIAYFADDTGGFVSLPDMVELRLITLQHRRFWRLKQRDGQALMIPVDAAQNGALFDAFAALPNINTAALVAALTTAPSAPDATQTLWRRA